MIYLGAIHKKINLGNLNVTQNLCRKQKRLREYISKVLFYILKPKCVIFRGDSDDSFYFLSFMNCCFYILSIIINEGTSYNIFFLKEPLIYLLCEIHILQNPYDVIISLNVNMDVKTIT